MGSTFIYSTLIKRFLRYSRYHYNYLYLLCVSLECYHWIFGKKIFHSFLKNWQEVTTVFILIHIVWFQSLLNCHILCLYRAMWQCTLIKLQDNSSLSVSSLAEKISKTKSGYRPKVWGITIFIITVFLFAILFFYSLLHSILFLIPIVHLLHKINAIYMGKFNRNALN